jgi:hypothetical protein
VTKHFLKSLDTTALAIALDRAEEQGLISTLPSPLEDPEKAVYLKYAGPDQGELIASRLAHVTIQLKTLGGAGNNKKIIKVFHKPAVDCVLGFLLSPEEIAQCTRRLDTVNRKYWKVL